MITRLSVIVWEQILRRSPMGEKVVISGREITDEDIRTGVE